MDVIVALKTYLNQMISECGAGMKALLMDEETISIVSSVYSQSQMLSKEVYLFERLDLIQHRPPLKYVKCIVFIRPTEQNLFQLQSELRSPKFASYYIYFSNHLTSNEIRGLAEADEYELIRSLKELYADFLAVNPHLYSLNFKRSCYANSKNRWEQTCLQRSVQGLAGLFLALKKCPTIRFQCSSAMCRDLAMKIKSHLFTDELVTSKECLSTLPPPVLLIIDRKADPITPLLNQWTYQAMIHELLPTNNNCIDLSKVAGVPRDMRQIVLSAETDSFYQNNMFLNYGEIGSNLKAMLEDFQMQTENQRKIESIADMKNFFEQYPEFKKLSGTVSRHVTLVGELSRMISTHKLLDVSEIEQELACHGDSNDSLKKIKNLIVDANVRSIDALRLVMLYVARNDKISVREKRRLIQMLKEKGVEDDQLEKVEKITAFGDRLESNSVKSFTKKMIKGLQGVENIYTQHSCLLKELLEDLIRGKLKTSTFPYMGTVQLTEKPQEIIVFTIGGVTFEESLAVYTLNKLYCDQVRIILGGTNVHNFTSYMQEISNATAIGV